MKNTRDKELEQKLRRSLWYFRKYAFRSWYLFLTGFSMLFLSVVGMLALPLAFGNIITELSSSNFEKIKDVLAWLVVLVILSSIATLLRSTSFGIMSQRMGRDI